jgi:hypothetical protein
VPAAGRGVTGTVRVKVTVTVTRTAQVSISFESLRPVWDSWCNLFLGESGKEDIEMLVTDYKDRPGPLALALDSDPMIRRGGKRGSAIFSLQLANCLTSVPTAQKRQTWRACRSLKVRSDPMKVQRRSHRRPCRLFEIPHLHEQLRLPGQARLLAAPARDCIHLSLTAFLQSIQPWLRLRYNLHCQKNGRRRRTRLRQKTVR